MATIEFQAIRAQGPGGQNVNKVSSAVQLRFDIRGSALPEDAKARLLASRDRRITKEGVLIIKAQTERTQELNRQDALDRLRELLAAALVRPRKRKPTRPTHGSRLRRLSAKKERSQTKARRRRVDPDH